MTKKEAAAEYNHRWYLKNRDAIRSRWKARYHSDERKAARALRPIVDPRRIVHSHRLAAMERGDLTFNSDVPCLKGHTSARRTSTALCIECTRASARKSKRTRRALNPGREVEARARYYRTHHAACLATARNWRRKNPERRKRTARKASLRSKYGLSLEAFGSLVGKQEGLCAICVGVLKPNRGTHVDHDHVTGKVRGLLCNGCNLILGHAKDKVAVLRAAADYLTARR